MPYSDKHVYITNDWHARHVYITNDWHADHIYVTNPDSLPAGHQ